MLREWTPMLYAVLCYNEEKEVGKWSRQYDDETMARLRVVQDGLAKQGRLGPVVRLQYTDTAVTLSKTNGEPLVVDGPFAETKEQFLGFYVVDCEDQDAAIAVAKDLAKANPGTGSYEIRPLRIFHGGEGLQVTP
jgi:hypothetical protein